jgi:anti-sigma factor RsiW
MECRQRGAISEEELLAYLAGEEVRPAVLEHLALCPACSAQVAAYRRLELTLMHSLYRWDCPPGQILGDYYLGLLSKETAVAVRFHLATCLHCVSELTLLSEFLASDPLLAEARSADEWLSSLTAARAPEGEVAPEEAVELSGLSAAGDQEQPPLKPSLWSELAHLPERTASAARRIVATLLAPQPRLAYQRDIAQAGSLWPRSYSAEDFSISLHIEHTPGRRDGLQLIGFVTRKGMALEALRGTPVRLISATGVTQTGAIDELGNFLFDSLAPSTYTLELQFSEGTVVIEQLPLTLQD